MLVEDVVRSLGLLCLGTRFRRLGERLQSDTQAIIEGLGADVQSAQYPLLAAVDRLGPLGIVDLAEAIGITQPGATRAVNQLVKAGLLRIEQSTEDQRRRNVSLTHEGMIVVEEAKRLVWPRIEAAVSDLCADLNGSLLQQISAIEDGLDERSLFQRHRMAKEGKA